MAATRFFPAPFLKLSFLRGASAADLAGLAISLYSDGQSNSENSLVARFTALRGEMLARRSACFAACDPAALATERAALAALSTEALLEKHEPARLAAYAAPDMAATCATALLISDALANRGF